MSSGSRNTVQLREVKLQGSQTTATPVVLGDLFTFQQDILRDYELNNLYLPQPPEMLGFQAEDIAVKDLPEEPEAHAIPAKAGSGKVHTPFDRYD